MFAPSTPRQKKQASRPVAAPARPQQVPAQPHFLKRRSTILAISSALIIAVGAYTGAVLKTDVQKKIVREEQKKEDPAHQIERYRPPSNVWRAWELTSTAG